MQAKVINLNTYPYKENFKGNIIDIPPGGHVFMDYDEAIEFKSSYGHGIIKGADEEPLPESLKKIKVEKIIEGTEKKSVTPEHICMKCSEKFVTDKALESHLDEKHLDDMEKEVQEKRKKGRPKKIV